jgi:hypothetical protein
MSFAVRLAAGLAAALALALSAAGQDGPESIAVGQVWSVRDAPGPDTRVVIGKIEDFGVVRAVHAAVLEIPEYELLRSDTTATIDLIHVPFEAAAFRRSLDAQIGDFEAPPDGFAESYAEWRAAAEAGEAGVLPLTVSEAVTLILTDPENVVLE